MIGETFTKQPDLSKVDLTNWKKKGISKGLELFNRIIKKKEEDDILSETKAWVSIFVIFLFTSLTIRTVQKTRRDAKVALETFYQDMSKYKDHECLKARTVHIKGILPQDRTGDGIVNHLNKILKKKSFANLVPGKVVSCLVISDFTRLLDLEGKI